MKSIIIALTSAFIANMIYSLYSNYYSVNNVCKTFKDYYSNRDQNENCYYKPDPELSVPEMIETYKYPSETHTVTTPDGYILTVFRIPNTGHTNKKKNPVLLEHGFAGNAAGFVGKGENSLAFLLSNKGYDVWIANFRGTKYSKNHTYLNNEDTKYWNFSFHEYAIYDIPAILDHMVNVTRQKVVCIGFSIGAASNYIYASTYPEEAAEKIKIIISLAPAPFLINIGSPMQFLLSVINYSYARDLLPFDKVTFSQKFMKTMCSPYPFQMEFCYINVYYSSGYYYKQKDPEMAITLLHQLFDTFSAKTFAHFSQLFVYGESRQFYYSPEVNLKVYGSEEPPHYNYSKILVPTYIYRTNDDTLITKDGVEKLYSALPKAFNQYNIHVIDIPHFSHVDFLYGKDAHTVVYQHILDFLTTI